MIHSLAGGNIGKFDELDFAKVRYIEGKYIGSVYFFISEFSDLKIGDIVLVPVGSNNLPTRAEIIRLDKNVKSNCTPVPLKHAKKIIKKI